MKVEIYSDVACPWCYIGKVRFDRALDAWAEVVGAEALEAVEVAFRPFQLDPGAPAEAVPMPQYLARRFGPSAGAMADRVSDAARGEGLVMDLDRGLVVNTLQAHRLMWFAEREHGPDVQLALAESLFEAYFAEGADVGDPAALAEVASRAGMDPKRVLAFLASEQGTLEVKASVAAAQRLGVTAVPTFVFDGRYAVQGAQPSATFLQVLEQVAGEAAGNGGDDASGG